MSLIQKMRRVRSGILFSLDERRARRAAASLRREITALPGLDADGVVGFLFSEAAAAIQPWQFEREFHSLAKLVERRRPQTVLEIGTADGGTLFAHARLAAEDAVVVSIDLPEGSFGGGYPSWRIPLYQSFAGPMQRLELLRLDSHAPSTAEALERLLDGRRIDYAFIDGDHTYDGVRRDFELCLRFAAPDAVIAFHDVVEHPDSECAVHDLWLELRRQYAHDEYVLDWQQGHYGIGVLYLDGRRT